MPVRFTSPSLGGQRDSFFKKGEWQVSASYRRLEADRWFVGTDLKEALAPFGKPLYLDINTLDLKGKEKPEPNATITATCVATTFVLLDKPAAGQRGAKPAAAAPPAGRGA